jgi:hypothetical protein
MSTTWKKLAMILLGVVLSSAGIDADQSGDTPEPAAFLPQATYEFEAVADGVQVVHDFILHNQGTAPLEIIKISSG